MWNATVRSRAISFLNIQSQILCLSKLFLFGTREDLCQITLLLFLKEFLVLDLNIIIQLHQHTSINYFLFLFFTLLPQSKKTRNSLGGWDDEISDCPCNPKYISKKIKCKLSKEII